MSVNPRSRRQPALRPHVSVSTYEPLNGCGNSVRRSGPARHRRACARALGPVVQAAKAGGTLLLTATRLSPPAGCRPCLFVLSTGGTARIAAPCWLIAYARHAAA
jgi:hypothetical protein